MYYKKQRGVGMSNGKLDKEFEKDKEGICDQLKREIEINLVKESIDMEMIRVVIESIQYYNKGFKEMFSELKKVSAGVSKKKEIEEEIDKIVKLTDDLLELMESLTETGKKLMEVKKLKIDQYLR